MKTTKIIAACLFVSIFVCLLAGVAYSSDTIMTSQLGSNQYAITYVNKGNVPKAQMKKALMTRAAKMTVDQGNRYFLVDGEQQVKVLYTPPNDHAMDVFPENAYQEMIIQENFPKQAPDQSDSSIYPGYKMIFSAYDNAPNLKAVDACTLTECPK